jgi:hypothetical protein
VGDGDLACLEALADEVKAHLDVLTLIVKCRIFAQLDG